MNACAYCGKENAAGQPVCAGCGTSLCPPVVAEFKGVQDPITPPRRCSCGGVMRYYRPEPGGSTLLRPYRYRYHCTDCGAEALVPPWDKRAGLILMAGIGLTAILWLCFSETAEAFDQSRWNRRLVIVAVVLAVIGLAAGHLALIGYWNRRRYPVVDESPAMSESKPSNPSEGPRNS